MGSADLAGKLASRLRRKNTMSEEGDFMVNPEKRTFWFDDNETPNAADLLVAV